jgi:iron complex outermembrane receptor protein
MYEPVENLSISFVTKYVGKQFIDNTSSESRKLNPYFVNDIRLSYSISTDFIKEIDFYMLINNILSEKYESNAWVYRYYYENKEYSMDGYFPQATIHLLAGISLRF